MPQFHIHGVRRTTGEPVTLTIDALSTDEVRQELSRRGVIAQDIQQVSNPNARSKLLSLKCDFGISGRRGGAMPERIGDAPSATPPPPGVACNALGFCANVIIALAIVALLLGFILPIPVIRGVIDENDPRLIWAFILLGTSPGLFITGIFLHVLRDMAINTRQIRHLLEKRPAASSSQSTASKDTQP